MATSTVEPARTRTKPRKAKSESGFSVKAWLFGASEADGEPDPEPTAPDEQSRLIAKVVHTELQGAVSAIVSALPKAPAHAASPTQLDGSHPAYLLRHLAMLALDGEIDPELTFQGAVERLQSAWDLLVERANEQKTAERRAAEAMAAGRRAVQVFTEAASVEADIKRVTGEAVELDIDAPGIGKGLAALHVNAYRPETPTMQFPDGLYTPGMPDPRKAAPSSAEVTQVLAHPHPWDAVNGDGVIRSDGSTPSAPLPTAEVQPAVPPEPSPQATKLPRRRRSTSFPRARMSADPGVPLDGSPHEAVDLMVMPGAWLLREGVWALVSTVTADAVAESVMATLDDDAEAPFKGDDTVWLLTADEAARLALAAGPEAHR